MTGATFGDPEKFHDLACPCCRSQLTVEDEILICSSTDCSSQFPVVDGRPVLINEANSIFDIADFESHKITTMDLREDAPVERSPGQLLRKLLNTITPGVSHDCADYTVHDAAQDIDRQCDKRARILVIGAGDAPLEARGNSTIVYSDVAIGRLTDLVFDAHDIPFPDASFDGVLAVAVLEHVADPARVVAEVHRVLKPGGRVFAITPFMQQVHLGRYDFTRFTHLGHRRLFRWFTEEKSGVANGPGMVLAWALDRWMAGLSGNRVVRAGLRTIARLVGFPFSISDRWLKHGSAAYDNASAYYFYGTRAEQAVSDREIVNTYKGTMQ